MTLPGCRACTGATARPVLAPLSEPAPQSTAMVITPPNHRPPKGAVISRGAIAADLDALAQAWQWTPTSCARPAADFHVHGLVLGLLGSLRVGNRFVHTGKADATGLYRRRRHAVFRSSTVWTRLVADPASARALASARLLVSG